MRTVWVTLMQPRRVDWNVCARTMTTSLYQPVGAGDTLTEHVHCVSITFKMTEWGEQWIYIKFCVKLKHSSVETIWMIQEAAAMGNWWLAASSRQCTHSCITPPAEFFFAKHRITQVSQPPYSPDLAPCDFWLFPKLTFEREEISDYWWDSGKYDGAADGDWENCVRSQGAYIEVTEASLSCVQCFLHLLQ